MTVQLGTPLADAAALDPADRPARSVVADFPARYRRVTVELVDTGPEPMWRWEDGCGVAHHTATRVQLPALRYGGCGKAAVLVAPEV